MAARTIKYVQLSHSPRSRSSNSQVKSIITSRNSLRSQKPKSVKFRTRQLPNTKDRLRKNVIAAVGGNNSNAERLRHTKQGLIGVIVGNGPSHAEAPLDELLQLSNIDFISVNRPDDRLWPTAVWCFCDNSQLRRHRTLWNTYNGIMCNSSAIKEDKAGGMMMKSLSSKGFSLNLSKGVNIGRSSCYVAMQVALWLGYDHIYVFGVDMAPDSHGKLYPWGSNPDVPDSIRMKRFENEAKYFKWAADNLPDHVRTKYTFCTSYNKYDFIEQFEHIDHMDAVNIIAERYRTNNNE